MATTESFKVMAQEFVKLYRERAGVEVPEP